MKNLLSFILLFTFVFSKISFAQDLNANIKELKKVVKEIKLEKSSIEQVLDNNPKNASELTLNVSTSDSKGKSTKEEYVFDLIFLDANKVKREASKSEISVELKTADNFDGIRFSKSGEFSKYQDNVSIRFDNADDAKDFEKNIKTAITSAKTKFETSLKLADTFAELQKIVEADITSFEGDGYEVSQKAARAGSLKDRVLLSSKGTIGKSTEDKSYDFSWGDLAENSVDIKVSGQIFGVEVKTADKNDFIKSNDLAKNKTEYNNEIKFYLGTPKAAKIMTLALKKFLPLAKKELQARLPKKGTASLESLNKISNFEVNGQQIEQKATINCLCDYSKSIEEKGKSKVENAVFNFSDLTDFKLKTEKDYVTITTKTVDNQKFVAVTDGNSKRSFEKELTFILPDLESARTLLANMPEIATKCKQSIKPENFAWLVKTLNNDKLGDISQKLSLQESGNNNKWRFETTKSGGKKTIEKIYEFNVEDLDVSKNKFEVDGQNLTVTITTNNKEKLLKLTEDGKSSFTNEVQFLLTNAEEVKKVNATLKAMIEKPVK